MKKYLGKFLISFVLIVGLITNYCFANTYSNNKYTITIPNTYFENTNDFFSNYNGDTYEIASNTSLKNIFFVYSEKKLQKIGNDLEYKFNNDVEWKNEILNTYNNEHNLGMTDNEIKMIEGSIQNVSLENSEILTIGSNGYQCFHYYFKMEFLNKSVYIDEFVICSGINVYIISYATTDWWKINSSEEVNVINSFEINNKVQDNDLELYNKMKIIVYIILLTGYLIFIVSKKYYENK